MTLKNLALSGYFNYPKAAKKQEWQLLRISLICGSLILIIHNI
jgi:hypothetical protein